MRFDVTEVGLSHTEQLWRFCLASGSTLSRLKRTKMQDFGKKCQKNNIFGGATPGIPRQKGPPLQPPRPSPRFQTPAF